MPNSQTLAIRDSIEDARSVRDAYEALTDLTMGDGSASSGSGCLSHLKGQNLVTLIDILNGRLIACLDQAIAECEKLDEQIFQSQRQTRQKRS